MNYYPFIITVLMIPAFIHASQLQHNVQLKKDDCIVFNEKGDMRIEKRAWDTHSDFDFGLTNAICPTVCGVKCPMDLLSKSEFYIFKTNPEAFPLFGQSISLTESQFDTSSKYLYLDSLVFNTIQFENFQKYYIFKSNVNKYILLIIDSLKTHDVCNPPSPCCNATTIECVYGKILFQTNGLPQFDQPVSVVDKYNIPTTFNLIKYASAYHMIDIQGRAVSNNTRTTAGMRLIVKQDVIAGRTIVLDHKATRRETQSLK